jgi:Flp pilus assembly protein TadD
VNRRARTDALASIAAPAAAHPQPAGENAGWKLLDGPPSSRTASKRSAREPTRPVPTSRTVSGTQPSVATPGAKAPQLDRRRPASERETAPALIVPGATSKTLRRVATPPLVPARSEIGDQRVVIPPPIPARIHGGAQRAASPPGPAPKRQPTQPQLPATEPTAVEGVPAIANEELPPAEAPPKGETSGPLELSNGVPPAPVLSLEAPLFGAPLPPTPSEAGAPEALVVPVAFTSTAFAPPSAPPPPEDGAQIMVAPTSLEVAPPTVAAEEEFALLVPAGINSYNKWLVASAVLGLVGLAALGLTVMGALSASSAAPAKAGARAAATVPAQPVQQTAATAAPSTGPLGSVAATTAPGPSVTPADALPQAAAEPPTSVSSSAIPWDDLPQTSTKSCEALAAVSAGPKAFLAGQAVSSAQRALVRGDTSAAHAAFCTAAQLGVLNDTVLLGLSRVLFIQSDLAAALRAVDQLIEQAPTNKQAFDLRGDILIRIGNVEEARRAWFKAAGATRASKLLVDNLIRSNDADAKTALRSGDLSRADRILRRNIALTSGAPEYCRKLITVLVQNGNTAAADRWRVYLSARGD